MHVLSETINCNLSTSVQRIASWPALYSAQATACLSLVLRCTRSLECRQHDLYQWINAASNRLANSLGRFEAIVQPSGAQDVAQLRANLKVCLPEDVEATRARHNDKPKPYSKMPGAFVECRLLLLWKFRDDGWTFIAVCVRCWSRSSSMTTWAGFWETLHAIAKVDHRNSSEFEWQISRNTTMCDRLLLIHTSRPCCLLAGTSKPTRFCTQILFCCCQQDRHPCALARYENNFRHSECVGNRETGCLLYDQH